MDWSNDDLQPLDFEEVSGDVEDDSGLPPIRWQAFYSIDTGEGERSLEPDPLLPVAIRHNDTVSRELVIDFWKQLKIKCGIVSGDVDIPGATEDFGISDEEGARSLSDEEEADAFTYDDCLVVVLDFDKIDANRLPDDGVLAFKIDPEINVGLKHLFFFAGGSGGVTTAVVYLDSGSMNAVFVGSAQRPTTLSSSNRSATLTSSRANPKLLITAVQKSEYDLSGTRNLGFSEIRA